MPELRTSDDTKSAFNWGYAVGFVTGFCCALSVAFSVYAIRMVIAGQ